MTQLSVQVIDCVHGRAAPGVQVDLEQHDDFAWCPIASGSTADDGGLPALKGCDLGRGRYRLTFGSASYFAGLGSMTHFSGFVTDFQVSETEVDLRVTVHLTPATFTAYWQHE